ncbi:hypothetical protein VUJ46_11860 [Chryseobacterium sp. MYb264]|uniref:hypothetical protein n=1 Tax=Chryseobacterium sp. MYb264 TaxID=2745153 RepID=UPI002E15384B|nr:hypothetical protein VUJ46_11860 [Chryseobacterium sp. MYb264]
MKPRIISAFILMLCIYSFQAQDLPTGCKNQADTFNDIMKGKITSEVRAVHLYYFGSEKPQAGSTYNEKAENLQKEIKRIFQAFMKARREEYKKTVCSYYKTDWNQAGKSSFRTLTVQPGFYLLKKTLKRTTNGDWKGGPDWTQDESFPTSITWKTGGNKKNETFVDIKAMYNEDYIKNIIIEELNSARKELNSIGIPTEIPPFVEG